MPPPAVFLLGPTASGKTAVSLVLASRFPLEIVSVDSALVYRGMDIGTAKPAPAERDRVPHYLIDICAPDETVTLGDFQEMAYGVIVDLLARGKLPILVGGTGQYVTAVVEGWGIPRVPPQPRLRRVLAKLGGAELARWLAALDAEKHAELDVRNVRRVIRALEVTLVAGRPISELQRKKPPPYDFLLLGLYREREQLYTRIDERVEQMMAEGLLDEVRRLHEEEGYGRRLPSMSGIGYRQLIAYLHGEISLDEAVQRIKFETHRFARQQNTWFRRDDARIHWFDAGQDGVETAVASFVEDWIKNRIESDE